MIAFATTGLSPTVGVWATEIAAVLLRAGRIVDRYHSPLNARVPIPPFITRSSAMARPEPLRPPIATPAGAESLLATGLWGLGARGRVARRSPVATAPVIDRHGRGLGLPTGRGLTGDGLGRWKARVRLLHLLTG